MVVKSERRTRLTLFTFTTLSIGILTFIVALRLAKHHSNISYFQVIGILILTVGLIQLFRNDFAGGLLAAAVVITVIFMVYLLQGDKNLVSEIYADSYKMRESDPTIEDEDVMRGILGERHPEIDENTMNEVISGCEDFEEMVCRVLEYEHTGGINRGESFEEMEQKKDD